jgi:hypothetical protein
MTTYITVILRKSTRRDKKYMVEIGNRTIHFGASGYSDFTKHKDKERRNRYDQRHKSHEDWTINGLYTAGFWAKWILWNKPSIQTSIRDIRKRFKIRIIY